MFREMRRKKQLLSEEETIEILKRGTAGVLSVYGDDGYPYGVPLSYVYDNSKLYFHCAKTGHKLDGIKNHSKVSFCVIDQDHVVPHEYTTYFASVIVFGNAKIMENDEEKRRAIETLALRYHPTDTKEHREEMIQREYGIMTMVEVDIEHMTGKKAIELVREAEKGKAGDCCK